MESGGVKHGLVRGLGWLVIAHGLAHTILPFRGMPGTAIDTAPVALYALNAIGFVAAGLGLLGVRPLHAAISPLLVLSSGLSLVAIQQIHRADLWIGGTLDVALFFLGIWRGYVGWPVAARTRGRVWQLLGLAVGFTLLAYVTASAFVQH
jgi:hypothetical protein